MKRNRKLFLDILDVAMFVSGLLILQIFGFENSAAGLLIGLLGITLVRGSAYIDKRPYSEIEDSKIDPKLITYMCEELEKMDKENRVIVSDKQFRHTIRKLLEIERRYYNKELD